MPSIVDPLYSVPISLSWAVLLRAHRGLAKVRQAALSGALAGSLTRPGLESTILDPCPIGTPSSWLYSATPPFPDPTPHILVTRPGSPLSPPTQVHTRTPCLCLPQTCLAVREEQRVSGPVPTERWLPDIPCPSPRSYSRMMLLSCCTHLLLYSRDTASPSSLLFCFCLRVFPLYSQLGFPTKPVTPLTIAFRGL